MSSSFQETCSNISINGDTLQATCKRIDGSSQHTSIQLNGIANIDGKLQFVGSNKPSSFQNSCRDISINGNVLTATCQKKDGGAWVQTQITLDEITNVDGHLTYE